MLLKKLLLSSLILGCVWLISCTDLSGSTSLGKDIVNEVDPHRTDINGNFLFSDAARAVDSSSTSRPNDTLAGVKTVIIVGTQPTRAAHGSIAFSLDSAYRNKHANDSIISTGLNFFSADTINRTVLQSLFIFDNTYSLTDSVIDPSNKIAELTGAYNSASKNTVYTGNFNQSGQSFYENFFKSSGKDSVYYVKYLITSNDSIRSFNPTAKLLIKFKSKTSQPDTFTDTINSYYSNYVIFDSSSTNSTQNIIPITSSETSRKAIFKISMDSLRLSMNKREGFTTLLSATLTIKYSILRTNSTYDTTNVRFRYYLSNNQIENSQIIRDSINLYGSSITETNGSGSQSLAVETYLRKLLPTKSPYVYLYIMNLNPNNIDQETLWSNPIITAVFTNNQ
jgi:hypothetical protein